MIEINIKVKNTYEKNTLVSIKSPDERINKIRFLFPLLFINFIKWNNEKEIKKNTRDSVNILVIAMK